MEWQVGGGVGRGRSDRAEGREETVVVRNEDGSGAGGDGGAGDGGDGGRGSRCGILG